MQDLMDLFERYMRKDKISEALIVGQNMFNQDSGNTEIYERFVGTLLDLAIDYHAPISICRSYCDQAELAVGFYAENAKLQEKVVDGIIQVRKRIHEIRAGLDMRENEEKKVFIRKKIEENDDVLDIIQKLVQKLGQIAQKTEFDKVLEQIQQLDEVLEKEYFAECQEKIYQRITHRCADIVDKKMQYFKRKENEQYNLKALESYEKAYRLLKNAENIADHKEIVKNFFSFDASKLFNETLVYYNHVYSYILSKMDDSGKFDITKLAIQCEKKYMSTKYEGDKKGASGY